VHSDAEPKDFFVGKSKDSSLKEGCPVPSRSGARNQLSQE
jgi:hypothetical protein